MSERMIDTNKVMEVAASLRARGDLQDAIDCYLFLADGDQSLDGGWLGVQIAQCYEQLGRLNEARYWAGRAMEENPELDDRRQIRERLGPVDIEALTRGQVYRR